MVQIKFTSIIKACSINSFTDKELKKKKKALNQPLLPNKEPNTKIWLSWQFTLHFKSKVNSICDSSQFQLILHRTKITDEQLSKWNAVRYLYESCVSGKVIDLFGYYLPLQHSN